MVTFVTDKSGRFEHRPHYEPNELDSECENIITNFLRRVRQNVEFPVSTDDLTILIEQDAESLDIYADLSHYGEDVDGVTEFFPGQKPIVKISRELSENKYRENRLRTTLTHEYGHVKFHSYLWELEQTGDLFNQSANRQHPIRCKRDNILDVSKYDWMEWQAGYVCGAMLMPRSYVQSIVGAYRERNHLFGPLNKNSPHGYALIQKIVAAFQVSSDAAHVRLSKLGYLGNIDIDQPLLT